ncbi:sentrin-specific protease 6-like [Bacillus rossius redtenbacheri]|uniref:sentrin-specific protease 6-like n=1 Tax=Bacillus rossius redtenbacheri TaxID=93214 RepID=UPI002FDD475C
MVTRTNPEVKPDYNESKIDEAGTFFSLSCHNFKMGLFSSQPKHVVITSTGINIVLQETSETFLIGISDISEILYYFGPPYSVIFIYCQPSFSDKVQLVLQLLQAVEDPRIDSVTEEIELVTLTLYEIDHESKIMFKNVFSSVTCKELKWPEANKLHLKPNQIEHKDDVSSTKKSGSRHSQLRKIEREAARLKTPGTLKTILVYPPPPAPGGIAINTGDYACLEIDQFLNDIIIDFYLNYLMISVLSEYDQSRTFIFSTFFYKRLTSPTSYAFESDPSLSPAEKRHRRVKSWTKNVNLFEKDFIVIPINKDLHWFLAIVCFPGLTGCVKMSDNSPVENVRRPASSRVSMKGDTITIHDDEQSPVQDEAESEDEDIIDELFADETESAILPDDGDQREVKCEPSDAEEKLKEAREPIKQPCILLFDSLLGENRRRVIATLREYLAVEYKVKMGKEREFTKDTIVGSCPKVPQQHNFTDCGLYLLQYAESFFSSPITDYRIPIQTLDDWFPEEIVNHKRQDICMILHKLMKENNVDFDELDLPQLLFYESPAVNEMLDEDTNGSEDGKHESECEDGFENDSDFDVGELYESEMLKRKLDEDELSDDDGMSVLSEDAFCEDDLCGNEQLVEEGEILEEGEVHLPDFEECDMPEDGEVCDDDLEEDAYFEDGELCVGIGTHEEEEFEGENLQDDVFNGGEFENSEEGGDSRQFPGGSNFHDEFDEDDIDDDDELDDFDEIPDDLLNRSGSVFNKNNGMVQWKYVKRPSSIIPSQCVTSSSNSTPVLGSNHLPKSWTSTKKKRSNPSATSSVFYRFSHRESFQGLETPQKKVKKK